MHIYVLYVCHRACVYFDVSRVTVFEYFCSRQFVSFSQNSGLSDWVGEQLSLLDSLDSWVLNLVISIVVAMFTEVTSNTATAQLLLPVLSKMVGHSWNALTYLFWHKYRLSNMTRVYRTPVLIQLSAGLWFKLYAFFQKLFVFHFFSPIRPVTRKDS